MNSLLELTKEAQADQAAIDAGADFPHALVWVALLGVLVFFCFIAGLVWGIYSHSQSAMVCMVLDVIGLCK
jgi:hypothetical protein